MQDVREIQNLLKKHKEKLKAEYNVEKIGIFGSYVREEAKKDSDLDLLVDFKEATDFFDFLELEEYLSKILNVKVDLVMKKCLRHGIGERIMSEVVYV